MEQAYGGAGGLGAFEPAVGADSWRPATGHVAGERKGDRYTAENVRYMDNDADLYPIASSPGYRGTAPRHENDEVSGARFSPGDGGRRENEIDRSPPRHFTFSPERAGRGASNQYSPDRGLEPSSPGRGAPHRQSSFPISWDEVAAAVREAEETEASGFGVQGGGQPSSRPHAKGGRGGGLVIDGASFSPAISPPRLPAEIDRSAMAGVDLYDQRGGGVEVGRVSAREEAARRARGIVQEATADAASRLPGAFQPSVKEWKNERGSRTGARAETGDARSTSPAGADGGIGAGGWAHRTAARRAQLEAAFGGLRDAALDDGPRTTDRPRDTRLNLGGGSRDEGIGLPSPRMAEALQRAQDTLMRAPRAPRAPSLSDAPEDSHRSDRQNYR